MRDITIGQYYPTDSVIHRLDPRVKLLGTLVFVVSLFVCSGIVGFVVSTAALAAIIFISVYYIFVLRKYDASTVTSKCFRVMSVTVIFATFMDTLTAVTISYSNVVPVGLNYFLNIR